MLLHIDFPNCMSHTFIFLYMLTIHFDDVWAPMAPPPDMIWTWNVFILSCCNVAHEFTYHSLHTLKSDLCKIGEIPYYGHFYFSSNDPLPPLLPFNIWTPFVDLQKAYIPLCLQWKRNLKWNKMHIYMFTFVLFYSLHQNHSVK